MEELQKEVREFLTYHGISQNQMAREVNLSPATVSKYLANDYEANTANIDKAVGNWLALARKKMAIKGLELQETGAYRQIHLVLNEALVRGDEIGLVMGQAGLGKTTALKDFTENNLGRTVYIEANETFGRSINALLKVLAKALHISSTRRRMVEITGDIIEALKGSNKILIVDQADYLSPKALEVLRQVVYDQCGVPLILAGLPRLEHNIRSLKNNHQQLASRIGLSVNINALGKNDAKKIVLSRYPELDEKVVAELRAWSYEELADGTGYHSVRRLSKLLNGLRMCLEASGATLPSMSDIEAAASMMFHPKRKA